MDIYRKNKGFTLIELMLSIGIASIIFICIMSILDFSIKVCEIAEKKDELILNGRYGIEYIKKEIKLADKIIPSSSIKGLDTTYPYNLKFVIVYIKERVPNDEYTYITYYLANDELRRIAYTTRSKSYPSSGLFGGYNQICEYVRDVKNTKLDIDNSILHLDFHLQKDKEELYIRSDIYIRCPIEN